MRLQKEFEAPNSVLDIRRRLRSLKQHGRIDTYVHEFRNLVSQVPDMAEADLVANFIEGLKSNTQSELIYRAPATLNESINCALKYEQAKFSRGRLEQGNRERQNVRGGEDHGFRPQEPLRENWQSAESSATPMEIGSMTRKVKKNDFTCYYCGKKGHVSKNCFLKKRSEVNAIEGENEEELSLLESNRLLTLCVKAGNTRTTALIDSGASYNFISRQLVENDKKLEEVVQKVSKPVQVVNGEKMETFGRVKVMIRYGKYNEVEENVYCYVVDIANYGVILGRTWLFQHNPRIDWREGLIEFTKDDKLVCLRTNLSQEMEREMVQLNTIGRKEIADNGTAIIMFLKGENAAKLEEDTEEQIEEVRTLKKKFPRVFEEVMRMPPRRDNDHEIDTGNEEPIALKSYRMSPKELDSLKEELDKLMELGYVRPSKSPWAAPVLIVPKKDGALRLCVDYRALNRVTKKHKYPIPRVEELLDRLGNSVVFSSLDLASGYHQIRIQDESIEKTAFTTRYGQFEYVVMPFGLTNAPATFQNIMNKIFHDMLDNFVIIYLDDILVFSKSAKEHKEHLEQVMEVLDNNNFQIKEKKCSFYQEEVRFLGFVVGKNGVSVDPEKVEVIRSIRAPKDVTSVRSFLGLVGFYRKFVLGFAEIASPLFNLLKNNAKFNWTAKEETSFIGLKEALIKATTLSLPDFNKDFYLITDASGSAVGGILAQMQEGILKPIAFESRKLSGAESNYPVHEQELLAVVHCAKVFRCYIEGRKTIVQTDHASLRYLKGQKNLSRRIARWMEFLESLELEFQYRPGRENQAADALTRLEIGSIVGHDWPLFYLNWPNNKEEILREEGENMVRLLERGKDSYLVEGDNVLKILSDGSRAMYVPFVSRLDTVLKTHCGNGHVGMDSTYDLMRPRFWWPNMQADIRKWVPTCDVCQRTRKDAGREKEELHPLPLVRPFQRWSLDFIGRLEKTERGNRWIITGIDHGTKWTIARALPEATSYEVAKFIYDEIFMRFGCPEEILTDRGSNFMEAVLNQYLELMKIKHIRTTAYHPRTNGLVERFNGMIGGMMPQNGLLPFLFPIVVLKL